MRKLSHRRWFGCSAGAGVPGWRCASAFALLASVSAAAPAASARATPAEPSDAASAREPLAALIGGLIAYTHWPTRVDPVRLCIWGRGRDVTGLQSAALSTAERKVTVQHDIEMAQAAQRCDALYLASSTPTAARRVAQTLVGRPVLVMADGQPHCADSTMFCIDTAERPLKFQARLDAIARSGLRVDPQALRIGRPTGGQP